MLEFGEWLIFGGRLASMVAGFIGGVLAIWAVADWAIGRMGRHIKAYGLLIEFAFYYRDFKKYLAERKK